MLWNAREIYVVFTTFKLQIAGFVLYIIFISAFSFPQIQKILIKHMGRICRRAHRDHIDHEGSN